MNLEQSEKMINCLKDIERMKAQQEQEKENKGIIQIEIKEEIQISKEDFKAYENCRQSGLTNMFDLNNVEMITGLDEDKIKAIIKGYDKLNNLYGGF